MGKKSRKAGNKKEHKQRLKERRERAEQRKVEGTLSVAAAAAPLLSLQQSFPYSLLLLL